MMINARGGGGGGERESGVLLEEDQQLSSSPSILHRLRKIQQQVYSSISNNSNSGDSGSSMSIIISNNNNSNNNNSSNMISNNMCNSNSSNSNSNSRSNRAPFHPSLQPLRFLNPTSTAAIIANRYVRNFDEDSSSSSSHRGSNNNKYDKKDGDCNSCSNSSRSSSSRSNDNDSISSSNSRGSSSNSSKQLRDESEYARDDESDDKSSNIRVHVSDDACCKRQKLSNDVCMSDFIAEKGIHLDALRAQLEDIKSIQDDSSKYTNCNLQIYVHLLVEELLRYLCILASEQKADPDYDTDTAIKFSPSQTIEVALNQLLLNPKLYEKICDALLDFYGKGRDKYHSRVLPHNPLDSQFWMARCLRLNDTYQAYSKLFHSNPNFNRGIIFW